MTADALPTVQMDGVAWTQVIVGNTVYVGGKFAYARPAGNKAGVGQIARSNVLAYNLTTGALISTFNPVVNAQVLSIAASPDGKTIYIGGDFNTVNGASHAHIAALDATTGAPISTFKAIAGASVRALVATSSAVYAGGWFITANGVARNRLAAFTPAGALTAWAPSADYNVSALLLSPDKSKIVIGGAFTNLNGAAAYGLGAVNATTGATVTWQANSLVRDYGKNAGITSLTTDGNAVYGTGFVYGSPGNVEGAFSMNPTTGAVNWLEDCHGDTYGTFPVNGTVYTISHSHFCANDGGWPVYNPWLIRHSMAFTANATGTLLHNSQGGYPDFYGTPSPSIVDWFPDFTIGQVTGQGQASWTITGNSNYIVEGGEFPYVNGAAQQGLVRFAVRGTQGNPGTQGPRLTGSAFQPTLSVQSNTSIKVSFGSNWDRDDMTLTYTLTRNGSTVWTTQGDSEWWNLPTLTYTDTGLNPGSSYTYQLTATDPHGNTVTGSAVATMTTGTAPTQGTSYDSKVLADGASSYWTLDEPSGSTSNSSVGTNPIVFGSGVARGASGPVAPETASTFDGTSNGTGSTQTAVQGPNTVTMSAWIKTTSTTGGKILSFGNASTGLSTQYDRQIYMDNAGHVYFGVVNSGAKATVNSSATFNDGAWHLVTATIGSGGLALYVDGALVGSRTDATKGQTYTGYWRVGGDQMSTAWPSTPTSKYFSGSIADVALFSTVLSPSTIQAEYNAA